MFHFGEGARAGDELAALARWWSEGIGAVADVTPPFVPSLLWSYLSEEIEPAWERGWQPADVKRVASRKLSANHGLLVVDVIADQAESYRSRRRTLPSWMDQLEQIGATVRWDPGTDHLALFALAHGLDLEGLLRLGLELLVMIRFLPTIDLPRNGTTRRPWTRRSRGGREKDEGNSDTSSGFGLFSPRPSPHNSKRRQTPLLKRRKS
jgi:hypothetical protein